MICLTDSPSAYPSSGAYCPVPYADVGAFNKNSGKPAHVIRLLAQAWLAGGLRVWGENAADLGLAIGGAYGLHWLQKEGHQQYLRKLIAISERSIAEAEARRELQLADRVRSMEIAFFRGLSNSDLGSGLRKFVRDNWGSFVEQDTLIALLRKHGVAVPHVFA